MKRMKINVPVWLLVLVVSCFEITARPQQAAGDKFEVSKTVAAASLCYNEQNENLKPEGVTFQITNRKELFQIVRDVGNKRWYFDGSSDETNVSIPSRFIWLKDAAGNYQRTLLVVGGQAICFGTDWRRCVWISEKSSKILMRDPKKCSLGNAKPTNQKQRQANNQTAEVKGGVQSAPPLVTSSLPAAAPHGSFNEKAYDPNPQNEKKVAPKPAPKKKFFKKKRRPVRPVRRGGEKIDIKGVMT